MDIKLKRCKNKYIVSSVIFLLLISLSAGMYSTYPVIKENAKKYEHNIFERSDFLTDLYNSNYSTYYDMLKVKDNNTLKPSDILLDIDKRPADLTKENLDYALEAFDSEIYGYAQNLDSNLKNMDYYAVNTDNNSVRERNAGEISALLADNPGTGRLEAINTRYSFYAVIDYNGNGDMSIRRIYGADKLVATDNLKNTKVPMAYEVGVKPIKNMTYIYAVPKKLQYEDFISNYKFQSKIQSYRIAASDLITPVILFIILVGLLIPYRFSKELMGFNSAAKIPAEISFLISAFTVGVLLNETSYSMIRGTLEKDLIDFSPLIVNATVINILVIVINLLFWCISFGIVFTAAVLLKHIWNTGIRQYLKENSLSYKFLRAIWRINKRFWSYLRNVDLTTGESKRLILLIGINFIILCIMSALWFFGIILAVIYTVIIFNMANKEYSDISHKYNKLVAATNNLAEGNLEIKIEEDLGLFNALKVKLADIQKGFKKAVNEEVKSQRMKTELITNVSHDLKTPLTSIISYVDLLKDENLSVDKRREYLDTLDRKSARLKDLIEDLFEVSKAASGNITLNIVDVDIVALMKQTLLELEDKISKAQLTVRTNYPEEKAILPLDSQRMFRVFENLIINITKYALEGSRVYIDVINTRDKVEIILKNMAAAEINFNVDEIMERFVRGDKSRNTEGSGLGLAIAKSFVELQGGKLDIIIDGDLFKVIITFDKKH